MIYHVHISKLVTCPDSLDPEHNAPTTTLYSTINDVPVPVYIPVGIPLTRPAIRDYLRSKQADILATYSRNLARQPVENHDVDMDFNWDVE